MSVELIVPRNHQKEFDEMIRIYDFCVARFGKPDYCTTWDVGFADHTEDFAAFRFWNESLATYVKLMFPDMMTRHEFDYMDIFEHVDNA